MTPTDLLALVQKRDADNHAMALVLLNVLKELGIDKVTGEYRGSGDSPDGCEIEGWMLEKEHEPKKNDEGETMQVIEYRQLTPEEKVKLEPYKGVLGEFVFNCSFDHWGGWYNNEGGHGTGTFEVRGDQPNFKIDYYQYVESEEYEGEHTYEAEGEHESRSREDEPAQH